LFFVHYLVADEIRRELRRRDILWCMNYCSKGFKDMVQQKNNTRRTKGLLEGLWALIAMLE